MPEFKFPSGKSVTINPVVRGNNPRPVKLSVARIAWNYAKAVSKWRAAGSPERTPEEIESILAICQACEHYKATLRPKCKVCGCSLNSAPNGLVNKIAMSTEACPLNPPKWTATQVRQSE